MRLLVFSDLHVHRWAYGAGLRGGKHSRLDDTLRALREIVELAEESERDAIVFAGDLFHRPRADAEELQAVKEILAASKVPFYRIAGNHDQLSRSDSAMTELFGARVNGLSGRFHGYDYCQNLHERIKERFKQPQAPEILVVHSGIVGAEVTEDFYSPFEQDLTLDELRDAASKLVIAGHFHKPQLYTSRKGPDILIPGAPIQHTWGDEGQERGVWRVDVPTSGRPKYEMLGLSGGYPKFVTLEPDADPKKAKSNFVRLRLPKPPDTALLKRIEELRSVAAHLEVIVERAERKAETRLEAESCCGVEAMVKGYAAKFAPKDERAELEALGLELLRQGEKV